VQAHYGKGSALRAFYVISTRYRKRTVQFANCAVRVKPQLPRRTTVGAGFIFADWSVVGTLRDKEFSILEFGRNLLATPVAEESLHVLFLIEGYLNSIVACRT
jgi:hypothetical protein